MSFYYHIGGAFLRCSLDSYLCRRCNGDSPCSVGNPYPLCPSRFQIRKDEFISTIQSLLTDFNKDYTCDFILVLSSRIQSVPLGYLCWGGVYEIVRQSCLSVTRTFIQQAINDGSFSFERDAYRQQIDLIEKLVCDYIIAHYALVSI